MNYFLLFLSLFVTLLNSAGPPCSDSDTPFTYIGTDLAKQTARAYYTHRLKVTVSSNIFWYNLPYAVDVCQPAGYPTSSENWVKYTCLNVNQFAKTMYSKKGCLVADEMTVETINVTDTPETSSCALNAKSKNYYTWIEVGLQKDAANPKCNIDNDTNVESISVSVATDICFRFDLNNATSFTYNKIYSVRQSGKAVGDTFFGQFQSFQYKNCTTAKGKVLQMEDMCMITQLQSQKINVSLAVISAPVNVTCPTGSSSATRYSIMAAVLVAIISIIFF